MIEGTQIIVFKGKQKCPRCSEKSYGCKSDTKSYKEGKLEAHYSMKKKYCYLCAYTEGDKQ